MVYIIQDCKCGSCNGGTPAPRTESGEMVFGGSICNCPCHTLKGAELVAFMVNKEFLTGGEEK